jgi:pimeloyl-ACP methyl ester carboxylesterase/DNA-binding CsgD family transcriptional regulator
VQQEIRFCSVGSARVALATCGSGPPLVFPSWWASHVEQDWRWDDFRAFIERLGRDRTVVRYDRLGTGLSDRDRPADVAPVELEVQTLAAVLDELGMADADLLGMSCGGCIALAFAAAAPQRARRLVLYGSYADGAGIAPPPAQASMVALVRAHWGMGSRLLAEMFAPDASPTVRRQIVAFQRASASAEMAAQLLELVYAFDVRAAAQRVAAPALVLHRRGDRAVPFALGRALAAQIAGARFLPLDGSDHAPWMGSAAAVLEPTLAFLGDAPVPAATAGGGDAAAVALGELSAREREVLRLVAAGLSDRQIADVLVLSPHTVHRHVANVRAKLRRPTRAAAAAEAARLGIV